MRCRKIDEKRKELITYYDWVSSNLYYEKPRKFAIENLDLKPNQIILNIPCGTGQNFEFFEKYLNNTGKIIAIDLSKGMLCKAKEKIQKNNWTNIKVICEDVTQIEQEWMNKNVEKNIKFDSILCDLGLSGFPEWKKIMDTLILLLKPNGKLVIMD